MDWVKWKKSPMDTQKDFALCFTVHGSTSFDPVTAVGGTVQGATLMEMVQEKDL